MNFITLKNHLEKEKIPTGFARRKILLDEMNSLEGQAIHCLNCTGTCCTFSANSMQITPLEALDIIDSLEVSEDNCKNIKEKMRENIRNYRLDREVFTGKKAQANLRKTYTCPFFVTGSKGCTIKKELKPYGCLGFNPKIENDNGSQCHSDRTLLEAREASTIALEDKANLILNEKLNLNWNKMEIPKAVLFFLELFYPEI